MRELLVSGLSKSFGTTELFHDVSFRVARGERAGLVGANGAGKTTLMRCLLGEEEPDGGTVRLESSETIGTRRSCYVSRNRQNGLHANP